MWSKECWAINECTWIYRTVNKTSYYRPRLWEKTPGRRLERRVEVLLTSYAWLTASLWWPRKTSRYPWASSVFSPVVRWKQHLNVLWAWKGNVSHILKRWGDVMIGCHMRGQGLSESRKERKGRKFSTFLPGRDNKFPTNSGRKIASERKCGFWDGRHIGTALQC